MDRKLFDHTILKADATKEAVEKVCREAVEYGFMSVCVNSFYTSFVREQLKGSGVKVCTVVGFPLGQMSTRAKAAETEIAVEDGADEIDMVINIGDLKDRRYDRVLDEIRSIKAVCGEHVLKVIIETCLLTEKEKIKMCQLVTEAGADYIKTSTGFSKAGATFEDIALFGRHIGKGVKMKAAGGIASFEDAEKFLDLGAKRLGTSRIVKLAKAEEDHGQKDVDQEGY